MAVVIAGNLRTDKNMLLEYDFLAPDTVSEILEGIKLMEFWVGNTLEPKLSKEKSMALGKSWLLNPENANNPLPIYAENIENSKRKKVSVKQKKQTKAKEIQVKKEADVKVEIIRKKKKEAKTKYNYLGKVKAIEEIQDTIDILGEEPYIHSLKYTELGPIVYSEADHPEQDLIMRWLVNEDPTNFELSTFIDLCKAKNYKEYRAALSKYAIPAQNFVFADNSGDIAITVTGKFPVKEEGQGKFIYEEITENNLWKGYIPFDSLPHAYNPSTGFVGSANQHSTSPNYPYYYNGRFDHYRGRILHQKLSKIMVRM